MPGFKNGELDAFGLLRPLAPKEVKSAQQSGHVNTRRVLNALADFGTLKTESVAAYCFPTPRYSQGLQLAQRKLKALAGAKMVVPRVDAHGGRSWVLTSAGAAMVGTKHGYDLNPAGAKYSHTHLGARYLIFKHVTQGYTCYSEHAIIHNRCPVGTDDLVRALGKIPDGLLLSHVPGAPPRIFALETEVAYKAPTIVSRQLGMLSRLGLKLRSDLPHIFSGLIVLTPAEMEWHVERLVNVARRRWAHCPRPQDLADHVLIARADLGAGWSFKGANESKLLL